MSEDELKASLINLNRRIGRLERLLDVAVIAAIVCGVLWAIGLV